MRVLQTVLATVFCAAVVGTGASQTSEALNDPATAGLKDGPLVVWMVWPGTAADRQRILVRKQTVTITLPTTVIESTTGDFGQPSSNVGQTSGSYGQTSSTLGQTASSAGQTAGSYGTAASNVGTAASNHGQTSSSYGTAAGNFGQAASTYGDGVSGLGAASAGAPPAVDQTIRDGSRARFAAEVAGAFPQLRVRFVEVVSDELQDRLAAAEHSENFPDLVIGAALPDWWERSGFGIAMLGGPNFLDAVEVAPARHRLEWGPDAVAILAQAPHPERARAFVVWLRSGPWCELCGQFAAHDAAAEATKVAVSALGMVLQGGELGALGDPEVAQFSSEMAQRLALMPSSPDALNGLKLRIDSLSAGANGHLAVVTLRAIASAPQAFGLVRAEVALRKDDKGRWKVLQISANVPDGWVESMGSHEPSTAGWQLLAGFTHDVGAGNVAHLTGISAAAPVDGDNRSPQPDLWWDDGDGGGALALEWQVKLGTWTDSRMVIFADRNPRLQTRVTARFARNSGQYRWRVWSVGTGGAVKLSPWRTLNITR